MDIKRLNDTIDRRKAISQKLATFFDENVRAAAVELLISNTELVLLEWYSQGMHKKMLPHMDKNDALAILMVAQKKYADDPVVLGAVNATIKAFETADKCATDFSKEYGIRRDLEKQVDELRDKTIVTTTMVKRAEDLRQQYLNDHPSQHTAITLENAMRYALEEVLK